MRFIPTLIAGGLFGQRFTRSVDYNGFFLCISHAEATAGAIRTLGSDAKVDGGAMTLNATLIVQIGNFLIAWAIVRNIYSMPHIESARCWYGQVLTSVRGA